MGEELANGYLPNPTVRQAEVCEVARYGGVEVDEAALDELHDGYGRDRLGERADNEWGLRADRATAVVGPADPARAGDLAVSDDGERGARVAGVANLFDEERLDLGVGSAQRRTPGRVE